MFNFTSSTLHKFRSATKCIDGSRTVPNGSPNGAGGIDDSGMFEWGPVNVEQTRRLREKGQGSLGCCLRILTC